MARGNKPSVGPTTARSTGAPAQPSSAPTSHEPANDPFNLGADDPNVTLRFPSHAPATLPHITTSERPRRASTARPIGAEDRALVQRATSVLRATQIVEPGLPAVRETDKPGEVTLITAKATALRITAAPARAPRRIAPRSWRVAAIMWMVSFVLVASGVFAAANLIEQRTAPHTFAPRAASLGAIPSDAQLTDAWATGSGVSTLEIGGGAGPGATAPGSAGLKVKTTTTATPAPKQSAPPVSSTGVQAAPVQPWPPSNAYMFVPGHPAFSVGGSGGYYSWTFGQCTWWAQNERRDENLMHMGNAQYWTGSAAARGYKVGSIPATNATVVFQPGVQGAGGAGHVAHVVAIYPDGWFLVSEMNFFWNGGGTARVDYRFAHSGYGVSFIY